MSVYTVGQINAYIKNMFSQDYLLHSVIVSGEVSNIKYHSSGHVYFTMKDESGVLSAVMFKGNAMKMTWRPQNGDMIEAAGSVGTYEKSGNYQLYVTSIQRSGAGAQHEELQKLIEKLSEKGMFDDMYKIPIPKYSFKVGVVTSPTGSVIHDIRQVAARRNPGVEIILQSAKVQGDGAASSIIEGIHALEERGVDVMIIGRGGGSEEDLSAFNDEALAQAIFDCSIPIISAVGHGDDESITDMVADVHAPTPSAAAELAVFMFDDFVKDVGMLAITLERLMQKHIDRNKNEIRQRMLRMEALSPAAKIRMQKMEYKSRAERLDTLMKNKLERTRSRMLIYIEKYKALSPLDRIGHGFAAVTGSDGKRITDIDSVRPNDRITLTMKDGRITATADTVEKGNVYDS
ncbi:MAG: exodeoxyribonuclease VII large subunit [Lachnospiraceae bacterium]|nr:exodeoxyribonuclease VII large subunit [Lachnospiraceae bacterium]